MLPLMMWDVIVDLTVVADRLLQCDLLSPSHPLGKSRRCTVSVVGRTCPWRSDGVCTGVARLDGDEFVLLL